jgi:spore coat polysaccharide biosynthesis protein SpsF (cytidylyltransferase family)
MPGQDAQPVPPNQPVPPDAELLERNCRLLEAMTPETAAAVREAQPSPHAEFLMTDDGVPSCVLRTPEGVRTLVSRRRPLAEAERLAEQIDPVEHAGVVFLGFGLGYHARAAAKKLRKTGVLIAIEPDVPLLRAVLERVDLSTWFGTTNLAILTDPDDGPALSRVTRGVEGILGLGVKFVETTADRQRIGEAADRFAERFSEVMRAIRSQLLTTMVHVETTLRNSLMNADRYAAGRRLRDLHDAARGHPAIVVSAGPSLQRNLALLEDPRVRDTHVIIAVQTVLKPMLERGIKPHFVCALDHHEISKRFYEGLTADDVEGVTLVVEPKANPAIADAFPGEIIFTHSDMLHRVLGEQLAGKPDPRDAVDPGATVAHLAYHLARHIGADPVALIGQDLGFTDGQYYAPGAAIHETWGPELNPFRTLEMLEWERIVRARATLIEATDHLGRRVYTDEQMHSYLVQFEERFTRDERAGLTTIDATEGGVAKRGTVQRTLAQTLRDATTTLPEPLCQARPRAEVTTAALREHIRNVRAGVGRVGAISRECAGLLKKMSGADTKEINRLIGRVNTLKDEVVKIRPAYELVHDLNQTGTLNRFKADRAIALAEALDPHERQRRQIDRDRTNVEWLADAAEQLGRLLEATLETLNGAPRLTRDLPPSDRARAASGEATVRREPVRIGVVIPIDFDCSGLGITRSLESPVAEDLTALGCTLERVAAARSIDRVVLLTTDPERTRSLVPTRAGGAPIEILPVQSVRDPSHPAIAAARAFSPVSWRGGLAGLTCHDEVASPAVLAEAMERAQLDAAIPVDADWALVAPELIDAVADRHREQPAGHPYAFAPAPVGLGVALMSRSLAHDLARQAQTGAAFATFAGVLGYVPSIPRADALGRGPCVQTDARARALGVRFTADTQAGRKLLRRIIDDLGDDWRRATLEQCARAAEGHPRALAGDVPQHVIVELNTGRRTSGARAEWYRSGGEVDERPPLDVDRAAKLFEQLGRARPDCVCTLAGAGDPLLHPRWRDVIASARDRGIRAIHLRTDLVTSDQNAEALLNSGADVISVDLMADSRDTYRAIMGIDAFDRVRDQLAQMLQARRRIGAVWHPWIVPRLTRCDATYAEIERFYDRWLATAGACLLDALPEAIGGQRIAPLPLPASVRGRMDRLRCRVLSDGGVTVGYDGWSARGVAGSIYDEPIERIWQRLTTVRYQRATRRTRARAAA